MSVSVGTSMGMGTSEVCLLVGGRMYACVRACVYVLCVVTRQRTAERLLLTLLAPLSVPVCAYLSCECVSCE